METKKEHFIEYVFFIGVSVIFLTSFIYFRQDRSFLKLISGLVSLTWGIIHSALEGRLTPAIVAEYVLFGSLAFLLLFIALSF
jgi:hypothetical protein